MPVGGWLSFHSCVSVFGQSTSHLWVCLRTQLGKLKYCEVPGPAEQMPEAAASHCTKKLVSVVIGILANGRLWGWAIFVSGPSVRVRHIKPGFVSHPVSMWRLVYNHEAVSNSVCITFLVS